MRFVYPFFDGVLFIHFCLFIGFGTEFIKNYLVIFVEYVCNYLVQKIFISFGDSLNYV